MSYKNSSSYTSSRIEKYKVLKDENGNSFNANSDVLKSIFKDTNFADSNLNNMDPNQIPTGNVHLYFNDSAPSDSSSGIHEYVFAIQTGNFVSKKILTQSEFANLENSSLKLRCAIPYSFIISAGLSRGVIASNCFTFNPCLYAVVIVF